MFINASSSAGPATDISTAVPRTIHYPKNISSEMVMWRSLSIYVLDYASVSIKRHLGHSEQITFEAVIT